VKIKSEKENEMKRSKLCILRGQCCCGRKVASTQTSHTLYKDETLTLHSYLAPF